MSFHENGMPVAIGVVNRFDSVITSLCGLPLAPLTSRKPSPPAPPALLITTMVCFIRPCLAMMPWMTRAIWSAPPPVPAGTMNSTVLVGSHAIAAGAKRDAVVAAAATTARARHRLLITPMRSSQTVLLALHFCCDLGCGMGNRQGCGACIAALLTVSHGVPNALKWWMKNADEQRPHDRLQCRRRQRCQVRARTPRPVQRRRHRPVDMVSSQLLREERPRRDAGRRAGRDLGRLAADRLPVGRRFGARQGL